MGSYKFEMTFAVIAAVLSAVGVMGVLFLGDNEKNEKRFLISLFSLFLTISVFSSLFCYFNGIDNAKNAVMAFRSLVEITGVCFIGLIGAYTIYLSHSDKKKTIFFDSICFSVAAMLSVVFIVNAFNGFLFAVENNVIVYNKTAFLIIRLFEILFSLLIVIFVFTNKETFLKEDIITFSALFVLFVAGVTLDLIFPEKSFFGVFGASGILVKLFGYVSKERTRHAVEKEEFERLRKDVSRTNVKLLHSQISPHFIYNALTAIKELPDNPASTKKAIDDFAFYLRGILSTINESEIIPFEKELENVQAYLRLEKIRFGNSLKVVYDIQADDFEIPALCVQILAENAVKHGVSVKRDGGTLFISTQKQNDSIIICVKDDGVGFDVNKALDASHVGINNVKNRISSLSGGELVINSELGQGTTAKITIPIEK